MHICVSKLTIIGSDNGLSPGRRQAIIWTNAGILLIGPLGTNFSEILIKIHTFSFKKMWLKVSTAKWRPSCLGLNVLKWWHPLHGGMSKASGPVLVMYTRVVPGWIEFFVIFLLVMLLWIQSCWWHPGFHSNRSGETSLYALLPYVVWSMHLGMLW